jgi:predicted anti-sigma-YlaC factor YlaD
MSAENPMTCEEALRLLAVFLDGELRGEPHHSVERHLEVCRSCYSRAEFERRLKAEIGRLRLEEVSSDFEARIRSILSSFAASAAERPDRS